MKLSKIFRELHEKRYTLMIVPDRSGTTKIFSIRKSSITVAVFLINLVLISTLFTLHRSALKKNTISSLNETIIKLQESYEINLLSIKTLQAEKETYLDMITKYTEESENIKSKLNQVQELESQIRKLLDTNDVSIKPSRGGNTSFSLTLSEDLDRSIENLNLLRSNIDNYVLQQQRIPLILPCLGQITSYFGYRSNPFNSKVSQFHSGIDIANSYGTAILATGNGTVTHAGWLDQYGYTVIINHGNGYESLYGHNSKLTVSVGQAVKRGQRIALMGSSGRSTGSHCHFELRLNSKPINPYDIIKGGT